MAVDRTVRQIVADDLIRVREELGYIPDGEVELSALQHGVTARTVRRWVQQHPAWKEPIKAELDDDMIDTLIDHDWVVAHAWEELTDRRSDIDFSRRTFYKLANELPPTLSAYVTGGEKAMRSRMLVNRFEPDRLNDVAHADHTELRNWIIPKGGGKPVKPWFTVVEEAKTRRVMAWDLDTGGRIGSEMVLSTLAAAVRIRPMLVDGEDLGVNLGGVPDVVVTDRGGDLTSERTEEGLTLLGIRHTYTRGTPWMNGKVESVMKTLKNEFCKRFYGYISKAERANNRERDKDVFTRDPDKLPREEDFVAELAAFLRNYNRNRPHTSLDGATPDEAWLDAVVDDGATLTTASAEALRECMARAKHTRIVQSYGINFATYEYQSSKLTPGDIVEVRFLPQDDSFIEVFKDGSWLCTAWRDPFRPRSEAKTIVREREREGREVRRRVRRVNAERGSDAADRASRRVAAERSRNGDAPAAEGVRSVDAIRKGREGLRERFRREDLEQEAS